MTPETTDLARTLIDRAGDRPRFVVAIAGPPGAGKSTLADDLAAALKALGESAEVLPMDGFRQVLSAPPPDHPPGAGKSTLADDLAAALKALGESAEVLPMDGFHMDDGILREKNLLPRKGAPETFDVRGFLDIVRAVRAADMEVLVPVFDRSRELAIAAARIVGQSTRFVLVEGNYLLLDHGPWARLDGQFDYSILISPPIATLEQRLIDRWLSYGFTEEEAHAKTHGNDLKNGAMVREHCRPADTVLSD